jgi:hypothetical protein
MRFSLYNPCSKVNMGCLCTRSAVPVNNIFERRAAQCVPCTEPPLSFTYASAI